MKALVGCTSCLAVMLFLAACKHQQENVSARVQIDLSRALGSPATITFVETRSVAALPRSIVAQFPGGLAAPNKEFRETDRSDASLPFRRLTVAGTSERYCVLNYEVGGIAHRYVLAIFELKKNGPWLAWAVVSPPMSDLQQAKAMLESGKLKNEPSGPF